MKKFIKTALALCVLLIGGIFFRGFFLDRNLTNNDFSKINLEEYLGYEFNKLDDDDIEELNSKVEDLNKLASTNVKYEYINKKMKELDAIIRSKGITIPYSDFSQFIEDNKDKFKDEDLDKIQNINSEIDKIQKEIDEIETSGMMEKLYRNEEKIKNLKEERGQILIKNNVDPYSISEEIDTAQKNILIIPISNGKLSFDINTVSNKDAMLYQNLWKKINEVITPEYIGYISNLNIFSDGWQDILAYVVQNDYDERWTISVDLIDSIDKDGEFSKEFTDTLIHEFMHIITLNSKQLADKNYLFAETYTNTETSFKKGSYMNLFYQKFWKNHKNEIEVQNRENFPEDEKVLRTYEFYEQYSDEFVSEYAATNPEEDIAETFMFFVLNDKPDGDEIRDQKINFLYEFPELVKIRDGIRANM